jgi:hypothetical protein
MNDQSVDKVQFCWMQIGIDLPVIVNAMPTTRSGRKLGLCDYTFSLKPKSFRVYSLCLNRQMSLDGTFFCPERLTDHFKDSLFFFN